MNCEVTLFEKMIYYIDNNHKNEIKILDWNSISNIKNPSLKFKYDFHDELNENVLSKIKKHEKIIRNYSYSQTLEKLFLFFKDEYPEFVNFIDFTAFSSFKYLSETIINAFSDNLSWSVVCTFQNLSEDLMRNKIHLLNFKAISLCQVKNMSLDFIF